MKVLIDGDLIQYSCGFASDSYEYKIEDRTFFSKRDASKYCRENGLSLDEIEEVCNPEPLEYCLNSVKKLIEKILNETKATEYQIYLTGKDNFRYELATIQKYKGNRSSRKPHWFSEIGDYLVEHKDAIIVNGQEADDAMGINQTEDTCIASLDKDMDIIPGKHYNWRKKRMYTVSKEQGIKNFYLQMLTGDRSDNIPGVPNIGPKRAFALLSKCTTEEEMWEEVLRTYKNKTTYTEEEVIEIGRLLWIRQERDQVWNPPKLVTL